LVCSSDGDRGTELIGTCTSSQAGKIADCPIKVFGEPAANDARRAA